MLIFKLHEYHKRFSLCQQKKLDNRNSVPTVVAILMLDHHNLIIEIVSCIFLNFEQTNIAQFNSVLIFEIFCFFLFSIIEKNILIFCCLREERERESERESRITVVDVTLALHSSQAWPQKY